MNPVTVPPVVEGGALIIGPSGSGKTSLLATLPTAADLASLDDPGLYTVFAGNANMTELNEKARKVVTTGQMDLHVNPSDRIADYEVVLRCREEVPQPAPAARPPAAPAGLPPFPGSRVRVLPPPVPPPPPVYQQKDYKFRMIDGPGGGLFGTPDQDELVERDVILAYRQQLVAHGRMSDGLMICLDATDTACSGKFFTDLPKILAEMASNHVLRFSRVALVITKADRKCAPGPGAQTETERNDPWDLAPKLLGAGGLMRLLNHLKPEVRPNVHCGWSSIYGFYPQDGSPNYDRQTGRMLGWDVNGADAMHTWRPFRVLDPFVFLATGKALNMRPIPRQMIPH
ncbi:MAG TPA: hypothetical protein VGE74_08920 [Gemmata sp.]